MTIRIDKYSRLPIRDQIKEQIRASVQAGQLRAGNQLPTIRELSKDLSVNFNTVAQAYRELTSEGVIIAERGRGTFITWLPAGNDLEHMRIGMLDAMVGSLFEETRRLGFSDEEILLACHKLAG